MTIKNKKATSEMLPEEVGDRLEGLLPDDALQDALEGLRPEEITGPGGLMTQLAGRVLDAALGAELTGHLGLSAGAGAAGRAPATSATGTTPRRSRRSSVRSQVRTPRDRDGVV